MISNTLGDVSVHISWTILLLVFLKQLQPNIAHQTIFYNSNFTLYKKIESCCHWGETRGFLLTEDRAVSASEPTGSEAQGFRPHSKKGTAQSRNWRETDTQHTHGRRDGKSTVLSYLSKSKKYRIVILE